MVYRCPGCGHSLEPLTKAMREAAERDLRRRERQAAYKRMRYHTDPAYRERQKERVRRGRSTASGAVEVTT